MNEQELVQLGQQAEQVAADYDARQESYRLRTQAEADLLMAVVERVKPALKALGERPRVHVRITIASDADVEERAPGRMVCLTSSKGQFKPTRFDGADDSRGRYGDHDLGLAPDGTFHRVAYEGCWSRWHGEADEWTATITPRTPYQACDEYDVENLIEALQEQITKQLAGKTAASTKANLERAEKLQAVTSLLKR